MIQEIKDVIYEFIYKYYIEPAKLGTGYNIIQEITYGTILAVFLYLFYKALRKLNIKIDEKFAIPGIVFSVLIALIRALVDLGYIERSFLTITPGIIFLIGGFFILTILTSAIIFKENYYKVSAIIGAIPLLYFLSIFFKHIHHPEALLYVGILVGGVYFVIRFLDEKLNLNILSSKIDHYVIIGQLIDASSTTVGIGIYGYWEQHPIPRFLMEHFGVYAFIPFKILVILLALYILNREVEDENIRNIIKLCIMALGLAPGLRDLFRTVMGV
ncbi:Protein of unknown function DUF63 [Methanocaldococcus vulcanius M7]|uniref:DUF63 family protein n=1 Tax=Methanocaldococcus vulcanius (strain ATCC 700851 / DSM 12094 / M7) TaxID=579137 RepID=C9REP6_METVM|nr:DUF63 family protein [Methanocaldococcus vulcanius]ACX72048.1 Protein of unknown function DUF63 [Methanocaldococcus vulcanius M7]